MNLQSFARVSLTQAPTPLEFLPNLSRQLGGPKIFIKRDDNTGLAMGGNKTRKLEFLIGDALQKGATHIVTQGATQSNHVRQTIAAANKFGLKTTALLEERVSNAHADYYNNGNVLLDQILGATIETRPGGLDMNHELIAVGERLKAEGEVPYLIPGGGSNPIGALGYVVCALEIIEQSKAMGIEVRQVVHATGSTGTQAGLVVGLQGSGSGIDLLGISVRAAKEAQEQNVRKLAKGTWELLNLPGEFPENSVKAISDHVGPGYGLPTDEMREAVRLLARTEGILLDPVYSGKGFAGLIAQVKNGAYQPSDNVIFVHTGGSSALFGYRDIFAE
ncbi:MAG: D-cysteine desulfhydrase [Burkholderiaceae bacterium]